jgi:hypothetical protein
MIYMAGIGDLLNRKTWWIDGSVGCKQVRKTIQAEKTLRGLERSDKEKNKRPQSLAALQIH